MQYTVFNAEQLSNVVKEISTNKNFPLNLWYEEVRQPKTLKQLRYVWGGLLDSLVNYFNTEGQTIGEGQQARKWDTEDVKIWLYHNLIGVQYKALPDGQIVTYMKTMSQMDKQEMSEFINRVLIFIDLETNCILRSEIRNVWLLHVNDLYWSMIDNTNFKDEDKNYLKHQSKQTCLYCGGWNTDNEGNREVIPHHVRKYGKGGTGTKPPDWYTIPLCHKCHTKLHNGVDILSGLSIYKFKLETYCKLSYVKFLYKL